MTETKDKAKATPKDDAAEAKAETSAPQMPPLGTAVPRVRWDDSDMGSSFANVVNVLATREEMTLLFGTNQTWNATGQEELVVRLSDRIVLSPYAAKRLSLLLDRRVKEYEQLFGKLDV
ncbi:DUF3467 domain-containing protein [Mesobacterium pallidum]|uniref:DUF3467 domain-containing protein n=1 Tax=Mesobacterium pallidum TaxID=2872037 RepID=UPI001EE182B5|nr:DUF3467 domain-containing protein [Mesobacterium pallidum]